MSQGKPFSIARMCCQSKFIKSWQLAGGEDVYNIAYVDILSVKLLD